MRSGLRIVWSCAPNEIGFFSNAPREGLVFCGALACGFQLVPQPLNDRQALIVASTTTSHARVICKQCHR